MIQSNTCYCPCQEANPEKLRFVSVSHECCNQKLIIINLIPKILEWDNKKKGWVDSVGGLTSQ